MNSGVYVVQLNNKDKYYIGKSGNIISRIENHKSGGDKCAKFVQVNGGIYTVREPLTPRDNNLSNWEKDETIMRMIKHGFNNVRGWEFTNTSNLTNQECDMIKMSIFGLGDRCRKCGNSGHFAKDCSNKKAAWLKNLEACYAIEKQEKTSIDIINNILDDVEDEEPKKTENNSDKTAIKEIAKTGRAKCQKCKELIPKGEIRIGKESSFKGQITIKWHHEKCHTSGVQNIKEKTVEKVTAPIKPVNKPNKNKSKQDCCNRCGRNSHWEKDCYASADVNGYELGDNSSDESSEEIEVWCCNYCDREFDTEKGARYHEMKYCKRKTKKAWSYT